MSSSPLKNAAKLLMLPFLVGAGYQKANDFDVFEMGSHPKIGELILLRRQDQTSHFTGICLLRIGYHSPRRKVLLRVLGFLTGSLTANKQVAFHSATLVSR
jgi:hypothetical protein